MAYLNNKQERVAKLRKNEASARLRRHDQWAKRGFRARFEGVCAICDQAFLKGTLLVSWDRANKRYAEKTCAEAAV